MNFLEKSLTATWPDGHITAVEVIISAPREDADGEFSCAVALKPDYVQLSRIHGVDGEQATQLSLQLCETLLNSYKERGATLKYPDGTEFTGRLAT